MRRIAVLGGGRWARVHISVLQKITEPSVEIFWLTRHNANENRTWLNNNGSINAHIVEDEELLWALRPDAVIITTATPTHIDLLKKSLAQCVPALCEKPFALDIETAVQLASYAQTQNTVAGVNLEFLYANYLSDFAQTLKSIPLKSVDLVWHDPIHEVRYGEVKKSDSSTPHLHDVLPHCWSVLQVLLPNVALKIWKVDVENEYVLVSANSVTSRLAFTFSLSREAHIRRRIVDVNNGMAILDFSTEPGTTTLNGKVTQNHWRGERPMAGSVGSFLKQIKVPMDNWCLSLAATLPAVALAEQGHNMFLAGCQFKKT
jgi:predicted dehydrogenase